MVRVFRPVKENPGGAVHLERVTTIGDCGCGPVQVNPSPGLTGSSGHMAHMGARTGQPSTSTASLYGRSINPDRMRGERALVETSAFLRNTASSLISMAKRIDPHEPNPIAPAPYTPLPPGPVPPPVYTGVSSPAHLRGAVPPAYQAPPSARGPAQNPAAGSTLAKENVEYPGCQPRKGREKVNCLIASIQRDDIPDYLKARRIRYLIALNRRNHWADQDWVRRRAEGAAEHYAKSARYPKRNPAVILLVDSQRRPDAGSR